MRGKYVTVLNCTFLIMMYFFVLFMQYYIITDIYGMPNTTRVQHEHIVFDRGRKVQVSNRTMDKAIQQPSHLKEERNLDKHINHKPRVYIQTPSIISRLGNQMSMVASALGIAEDTHKQLVISSDLKKVTDAFILPGILVEEVPGDISVIMEKGAATYDSNILSSVANSTEDVRIVSYLQSWRYFRGHEVKVNRMLRFNEQYLTEAVGFIQHVQNKIQQDNTSGHNATLVGIHVRRGDMQTFTNTIEGYTVASEKYFRHAMMYYQQKYPNVHFVVCSDDKKWVQRRFDILYPNIFNGIILHLINYYICFKRFIHL